MITSLQGKFPPFYQYTKTFNSDTFDYSVLKDSEHVFMRWKEHFLVPDHTVKDINGASFAGFYYICFQKSAATIDGYYYHRTSEWWALGANFLFISWNCYQIIVSLPFLWVSWIWLFEVLGIISFCWVNVSYLMYCSFFWLNTEQVLGIKLVCKHDVIEFDKQQSQMEDLHSIIHNPSCVTAITSPTIS